MPSSISKRNDNFAVEVFDLEKKFGNFTAVDRISFKVQKGEIFGFLGPNGAGKSTTIRMLCGILSPSSGGGQVGGYDIIREQERIKQNIGYMSQKFSLYDDLTVEENINFYSGIYGVSGEKKEKRKKWILRMAELEDVRSRLTRTLPVGWKQRLALGCAIIHEPRIVFLDEPTSGVDPIARKSFWNLIKGMTEEGITVFVTTHYMDEAENCERMALIYRGSIIAMGTPEELKTKFMKNDVLEIYLPEPEIWIERLRELSEVRETGLFSTSIHAVVEKDDIAVPAIKSLLKKEGVSDFRIKKIQASLEDVFVTLIEARGKKEEKDESKKG